MFQFVIKIFQRAIKLYEKFEKSYIYIMLERKLFAWFVTPFYNVSEEILFHFILISDVECFFKLFHFDGSTSKDRFDAFQKWKNYKIMLLSNIKKKVTLLSEFTMNQTIRTSQIASNAIRYWGMVTYSIRQSIMTT